MVRDVEFSSDGKMRRVLVEYRNLNENVNRQTYRATRNWVMIHPLNELSLSEELCIANSKYKILHLYWAV